MFCVVVGLNITKPSQGKPSTHEGLNAKSMVKSPMVLGNFNQTNKIASLIDRLV
jgi:hypothetical protein